MSSLSLSLLQQEFIEQLIEAKVTFLVIGGFAVKFYIPQRQTSDLDILLSRTRGNAIRMDSVLRRYERSRPDWQSVLVKRGFRLVFPNEQTPEVDVLTSVDGVDFSVFYARSVLANFGSFKLNIPSLQDLIAMKKISLQSGNDVVAHKKDREDITILEQLV